MLIHNRLSKTGIQYQFGLCSNLNNQGCDYLKQDQVEVALVHLRGTHIPPDTANLHLKKGLT